MLGILLDAGVLILLIKLIGEEDIELLTAAIVGFVTSIGTAILAFVLVSAIGIAGVFVAGVIAAVALGAALSTLLGIEIKRSMAIGAAFMVIHFGIGLGINMMLS